VNRFIREHLARTANFCLYSLSKSDWSTELGEPYDRRQLNKVMDDTERVFRLTVFRLVKARVKLCQGVQ
jgi:hypothetical protein